MRTRITDVVVAAVVGATLLAGCATASYDERMTYLHKVAQRGVETHQLLVSQEAPKVDQDRCRKAWGGLNTNDAPSDVAGGGRTADWDAQIEQFFVDSCVSGKPKPVPGQSGPAPTPATR
jgi:outer membrane murein-binding lipoprotein Lpp